jgi:hypothetical protein
MNKSIYKKKSAFKQSLPQYRDGGKKFAAGLAGFTTKIPVIGDMLEQPLSNTKVAKKYKGAFDGGQFVGALAETGANIAVGNVPGAISSGADAMQEGLEMGSSVASNNNNLDRAKRLTTASTAFGTLEQGAGMFNISQFGGGFNPMEMMGDADIPMMMKNGGKLKQYPDGGIKQDILFTSNPNDPRLQAYNDSLTLHNATLGTIEDLKNTKSSDEWWDKTKNWKDKYRNITNKAGDRLTELNKERPLPIQEFEKWEGLGYANLYKKPTQPVALKQRPQEKPIDTSNLKSKVSEPEMKKLSEQNVGKMKSNWQKNPNYPGIEMSLDEEGVYRDKEGLFTGEIDSKVPGKLNILERFKDGGNLNNNLIKYNLPSHEDGGGAIDANGKLVNPNSPLAQAELEKTETLDTKQNYVFSDTLKPMKSKLTFADLSKRIDNKYKDKNDAIATNSKDRELERLAQSNEELRLAKEAKTNTNPLMMAKNGGKMNKLQAPVLDPDNIGYISDEYGNVPNPGNINLDILKSLGREDKLNQIKYNNWKNTEGTMFPTKEDWMQKEALKKGTLMKNGGKLPKYFNGGTTNNLLPFTNPLNTKTTDMFTNRVNQGIFGTTELPLDTSMKYGEATYKQPDVNTQAVDNNPFKMTTGDKMQLGAGALSGITNLAMGIKKPEEYPVLTSPMFGAGLNDMNQNVRFNTNPILMNRNVGMNQINQGSTSDAVRRANLQSLTSNTNRALGELAEKEALANVGIKQDLGRAKIGVGNQDLNARMDSQNKNIQSKAIAQNLRAKGLEQIYGSVSDTGKGMNQRQTNNIQLNVLNSLAAQYGIDPKTMEIKFKELGYNVIK